MGFTVAAPAARQRRETSPGLQNAVNMLLQFQLHKRSLAQNQKQFEEELLHRKELDSKMTADMALKTGAAVKKSDAQVDLFRAQEESVRKKTAFDNSSMGKMLQFADARRKGQGDITKVWADMMSENSPNMNNQVRAETFAHILASTQQASSLDPDSTMSGFLPTARQNSNAIFNAQSNQDMRTAQSFIDQFEVLDKKDPARKNLNKVIGTFRKVVAGEQLPRAELDRTFNAAQYNLDPDKNIDIAGFFNSAPAGKLTNQQLTDFQTAGKGSLADKRLVRQEVQSRGLAGFVPAQSTVNAGVNALTDPNSLTGTANLETKTDVNGKVLVRNPADGLWYDREEYLTNTGR